jgi:Cu/Ag efflux pump CusA
MVRLTRRKSEERKAAVLDYFLKHPHATGDEAQAALTSGKLTGEKGPQLSTGVLYELRKRAGVMLPDGARAAAGQPASGDAYAELRERAEELKRVLLATPGVSEVIVTREGARVVRLREEAL